MNTPRFLTLVCLLTCSSVRPTLQAQVTTPPAPQATDKTLDSSKDDMVMLSPFVVTTDSDKGYRATNSISGTRLNSRIQDLPLPIEVITEDFMNDIGATDLRQALRYSSGILTQTQNDYGSATGSYSTSPGKVNSPEGLSGDPSQSRLKIRGFPTDSVLRDGFRRQNATDTINISRVEVARGPASLLYGVGNFGGVVNYLPKLPTTQKSEEVSLAVGSFNFKRATIDVSAPLNSELGYRLTAAYQDTGSYTDFNTERHFFVSPVIVYKPFANTKITLDLEFGKQWQDGIGWQSLRAASSLGVNRAEAYNANFLRLPGEDIRTFRWSGPDTYRNSKSDNIELKVEQKISDNLQMLVGYNHSKFDFVQRDNLATLRNANSTTPAWAIAPVTYVGLTSTQRDVPAGPQPSTIIYQWQKLSQVDEKDQLRAELDYHFKLFEQSSKWLKMDNSFLGGFSYSAEKFDSQSFQTPPDVVNYHSPADQRYFRFGTQGDGSAEAPLAESQNTHSKTSNPASYLVYQGKVLDDRLTLIAGVRRDRSWNRVTTYNPQFLANGTKQNNPYSDPVFDASPDSKNTTYQYGANLQVTRDFSVYAMHSEGVEPNYKGKIDLLGNPLSAALAKNKEYGIKFGLLGGRISGTISRFEIVRTHTQIGDSSNIWFAPILSDKLSFDPNKDVVFRVDQLDPYNRYSNGPGNVANRNKAQWDAAEAAGLIYTKPTADGKNHLYLNASKSVGGKKLGADTLDAYWKDAASTGDWYGWLWDGADPGSKPFDPETNNATMDDNGAQTRVATGSDQSKGWDGQVLISPTDSLQVYISFAHTEKTVLSTAVWAKYPSTQDRWAVWNAPGWPVFNTPTTPAYKTPLDTSTHIQFGEGLPLDDTPKNQGSIWVNYQVPKTMSLHGLSFGAGAAYEGPRSIYPAYGEMARDQNNAIIFLSTKSKTIYNAMVKYSWVLSGHATSVQLNAENLLDNQKLYGFIYQSPRRFQLQVDYKL